MPEFAYTARDAKGQKVSGTVSAASERDVVALLAGRSLFPVEVTVPRQSAGGNWRVGAQLMATTYGQLASLLRNGVPLLKSINVLRDQTSNDNLKNVLDDVHGRVEEGATLADAMARHRRAFSEMAINMVRAGGEGGFLEDALDRVAQFTEQQEDLRSRTLGAVAYPAFLAVVGTLVVAALLVFFVPGFEELFSRLRDRGELPIVTDALLTLSGGLQRWGLFLALGAALVGAILYNRAATEEGRRYIDRWKLRLPLAGGIFQSLAVARFCRILGTMLRNGVPILKALDVSREAAGNRVLSQAIARASQNITAGEALAPPLAASGYFPPLVVEMIAVAEEANTLDTVLVDIADGLERRTARQLDLMVRLLEPILLLILAGIVLVVVVALLLPVLRMSSTL
jgi:type II secretory pathway component PulF